MNVITSIKNKLYSTRYNRWHAIYRNLLFNTLKYSPTYKEVEFVSIPKIPDYKIMDILVRLASKGVRLNTKLASSDGISVYYHNAPRYFLRFSPKPPYFYNEKEGESISGHTKRLTFPSYQSAAIIGSQLNSNLFYLWFILQSNCRDLTNRDIYSYFVISDSLLESNYDDVNADFEKHRKRKDTYYKSTGKVIYDEYYPKLSKPIIDEIDTVLARHYGFTEEELDFIINYDIKYRMGDELNAE